MTPRGAQLPAGPPPGRAPRPASGRPRQGRPGLRRPTGSASPSACTPGPRDRCTPRPQPGPVPPRVPDRLDAAQQDFQDHPPVRGLARGTRAGCVGWRQLAPRRADSGTLAGMFSHTRRPLGGETRCRAHCKPVHPCGASDLDRPCLPLAPGTGAAFPDLLPSAGKDTPGHRKRNCATVPHSLGCFPTGEFLRAAAWRLPAAGPPQRSPTCCERASSGHMPPAVRPRCPGRDAVAVRPDAAAGCAWEPGEQPGEQEGARQGRDWQRPGCAGATTRLSAQGGRVASGTEARRPRPRRHSV
jgi:hypothetical protein